MHVFFTFIELSYMICNKLDDKKELHLHRSEYVHTLLI